MDELTSGEEYVEPEQLETLDIESDQSDIVGDQESVQAYTLLTADDLPFLEYASIGAIACGSGILASIGVGVLLGILKRA